MVIIMKREWKRGLKFCKRFALYCIHKECKEEKCIRELEKVI